MSWSAVASAQLGTIFYQPSDIPENVNGLSFDGTSTLNSLPPLVSPLGISAQSRWAAGDVDGDGAPDIVTMFNGVLDVYRFDATAGTYTHFPGPQISLFLDGRLFLGDVDGDGDDEILVLGFSSHLAEPRPAAGGTSDLTIIDVKSLNPFQLSSVTTIPNQFSTLYTTVAAGDINLDGRADVLILTQDQDTLSAAGEPTGNSTLYACSPVLTGSPACTTLAQATIPPNAAGRAPRALAVADVVGHRQREIFVGFSTCCETSDPGTVRALQRSGTTFNTLGETTLGSPFQRMAAGQLGPELRDDIVFTVGGQQSTTGSVQVFHVNSAGTTIERQATTAVPIATTSNDGKEPPANVFVAQAGVHCDDSDQSGCLVNILAVPLCWTGDQSSFDTAVATQRQFMIDSADFDACSDRVRFKTLPVPPSGSALATLCTTCAPEALSCGTCMLNGVMNATIADGLATKEDFLKFDLIGGFVQNTPCNPVKGQTNGSSAFWAATQLPPLSASDQALGLENHPELPTTHEWGHTKGLGEEYCSVAAGSSATGSLCSQPSNPNPLEASLGCDETQPSCCFAALRNIPSPPPDPTKPCFDPNGGPIRCCAGNKNELGGRCIMSHAAAPGPRAFCDLCKQQLRLEGMSCSERFARGAPLVFGSQFRVRADARIELVGSATGPGFIDERLQDGPYELRFTDASNQILASKRFDLVDGVRDFAPATFVPSDGIVGMRVAAPPAIVSAQPVKVTSLLNGVVKARMTLNGHPPIANAGPDVAAECTGASSGTFTLNGTGSSDPDGDDLSYAWSGPLTLTDPESPTPSGVAPLGTTTVTLAVSDGISQSAPDTALVTIKDTQPPRFPSLPTVDGVICSDAQATALPIPVATDACSSSVSVQGVVVSSNGQPVNIPVAAAGVVLPPGEHLVRWSASDGSGNTAQAMQTVHVRSALHVTRSLEVGIHAKVVTGNGFALVANSGTVHTELESQASVGGLISEASVELDLLATVNGNLVTHGNLLRGPGTTVSGTVRQQTPTGLLAIPSIQSFSTGSADVVASLFQGQSPTPGSYRNFIVNSGGKLTLQPGNYFLRSLVTLPHASIIVASSGIANVFISDQLIYQGSVDVGALAVAYTGVLPIVLQAPFRGGVLSPNADVFVNASYNGALAARSLTVGPNVTLTCTTPEQAGVAPPSGLTCSYAPGKSEQGRGVFGVLLGMLLWLRRRQRRPT